ncbi:hypothetical protein CF65_00298 [Aggregatibacter actinomycetemcomitans HK1651]|nr:hypothetical protein CF65_00298 [Aggregatibacter actinomycetemcomitans HK1651]
MVRQRKLTFLFPFFGAVEKRFRNRPHFIFIYINELKSYEFIYRDFSFNFINYHQCRCVFC